MKQYKVTIGGVDHTILFSDEDAKLNGLTASDEVSEKAAPAPANKARKAANKGA